MLGKAFMWILFAFASMLSVAMSDDQGNALINMKNNLNVPPNQLTDWNPNQVTPCTWSSIKCDENGYVSSITLPSMGLTGTLSDRIGTLKYLHVLTLRDNKITGKIPETFGNITSLTTLNLENNNLNGEIPSSLGNLRHLEFLLLSQNELSGSIPESLSNLTSLSAIQLAYNNLSGQIPKRLFRVAQYNIFKYLMHLSSSIKQVEILEKG